MTTEYGTPILPPYVYRDLNNDYGINTLPAVIYDAEAVKRKMLNLFRCPRGSRYMRPTFGCNLSRLIHEPCDDITAEQIFTDLFDSIREWLPEVSLDLGRCTVDPLENGTGFRVVLTYSVPKLGFNSTIDFSALKT